MRQCRMTDSDALVVQDLPAIGTHCGRRRLCDVDAVVGLDFGGGYLAVHEIADQGVQVALARLAKAAAARRHDGEVLATLDTAAEFARNFFARAAVFFEIERAETAVAAVV